MYNYCIWLWKNAG